MWMYNNILYGYLTWITIIDEGNVIELLFFKGI